MDETKKMVGPLARVGLFLLDLVEIWVPTAAFTVMFLGFLLGIFFRYFLNNPLTWPHELTIVAFIWTTLLGACLAKRLRSHVAFTLIYERTGPRTRLFIRLAGNLLIVAAFVIAFYPTYDYVKFVHLEKTTVLRIPFDIVYLPYLFFLAVIGGRTVYDLVSDLRALVSPGAKAASEEA